MKVRTLFASLAILIVGATARGAAAQEPPWLAQTPDGTIYLVNQGLRIMYPLNIYQVSDADFAALPVYGEQATSTSAPPADPQPQVAAVPTAAAPTRSAPSFGEGTKIVGTDISPGTYRTRSTVGSCYWARLSGFGGNDIIANSNTNGPTVVTIAPNDAGFESRRCGTWTQDLSAITSGPTEPFAGDGTYIVGVDIAPGTWRASGASRCYWARLNGFGGTRNIIANDNPAGATAVVTIAAGDKGFETARCGTWTKI